MNRATLLGNVGRDPEIRHTQDGKPIANFSIATSESWKDKTTGERKERTEWHRIVCFNENISRVIEQYVEKGSKVMVEGVIRTRQYTDKDGVERYATEIVIEQFKGSLELVGKASGGGNGPGFSNDESFYGKTTTREPATTGPGFATAQGKEAVKLPPRDLDDEVPF